MSAMSQNELSEVFRMYRHYFDEMSIMPDMANQIHVLTLFTKENKSLKIAVCNYGWYLVDDKSPTYYESFEAMMNVLSPGFRSDFGNELIGKLAHLKRDE